ncbi:MAG TPA: GDP-mannose 4,6-dehydratase [Opitutaceae bacterium]|jgi:GDPmannose 4,6-dehydratase|nr:GDP-mannose 4,6-dehydratase [Opitutaceae bacterium]
MKKALIVGRGGQDGRLLHEHLVQLGYQVAGIGRHEYCSPAREVKPFDIKAPGQVSGLLGDLKPDEIYYLAAHHHSSEEAIPSEEELWRHSFDVHVHAWLNFLEAARVNSPHSRLFYAASSLIYGVAEGDRQNEDTPWRPQTPYGVTKASGMLAAACYRTRHGLFSACGILFNHESELRSEKFISQKIVRAAVAVQAGRQEQLVVGDLGARVDWGYARDYVEAMRIILQLPEARDFVVASGNTHSVRDLAETAFALLGLDWKEHVIEDSGVIKRQLKPMIGDASKLFRQGGWLPRTSFREMIRHMLVAQGGRICG